MRRRLIALLLSLVLAGCVGGYVSPVPEQPCRITADGTVVWNEEYAFRSPGPDWQLMQLAEDDYAFAYIRPEPGEFPRQTTIAYAEEPFGYSRDLRRRADEFLERFLWAARVDFEEPRLRETELFGKEGLILETVGHEPVQKQKVLVKVIFGHRGERVVAFYMTQWRPQGAPFDRQVEEDLSRFIDSFRFLRPSFYQRLLGEG